MGLLTEAKPLSWEEAAAHMKYVRDHGVDQFVNTLRYAENISGDKLFYGDEIEYGLFKVDKEKKRVYLSLRGKQVMDSLQKKEKTEGKGSEAGQCNWVPEYGAWMVEATPSEPYGGFTSDLRRIESNMRARRSRLLSVLEEDEIAPTVVVFPLLGVGDFTGQGFPVRGPVANSRFVPDEIINPHPRFGTLTRNIRARRGRNVKIMAPLFQDKNTDNTPEEGSDGTPGIYMDAMAFGMGCCCLQVTFQARDLSESRHLYDALAVLAPIMLAASAATPILKGKLSDWDVRWKVIEDSVDCRTYAEYGEDSPKDYKYYDTMVADGKRRLMKSRYSSIDMYICNHLEGKEPCKETSKFNDIDIAYDKEQYDKLRAKGVDHLLALHVAHLFVRDPLVIFEGHVESVDDTVGTEHWENIQSTNWNSVRWKPPPHQDMSNRKIGWRTEFRSMDIQLTDFENAAFTVFITLVSRALLSFDLNVYIPISKSDENMRRAHKRDAIRKEKFWFRSHLVEPESGDCPNDSCAVHGDEHHYEEMSVLEILTGKGGYFPGFVPLVIAYMNQVGFDTETQDKVHSYMSILVRRASGELLTGAGWIRKFVQEHAAYKQDSIVSEEIAYDLMMACHEIGLGIRPCAQLLGDVRITKIVKENAYNVPLTEVRLTNSMVFNLLDRYSKRAEFVAKRRKIEQDIESKEQELQKLKEELVQLESSNHLSHTHDAMEIPGFTSPEKKLSDSEK
eukprot:m.83594 g.83594  ORF g.83594 m.83594 type:complete len:731 (-) comp12929_c0_seq3:713-2905(-)